MAAASVVSISTMPRRGYPRVRTCCCGCDDDDDGDGPDGELRDATMGGIRKDGAPLASLSPPLLVLCIHNMQAWELTGVSECRFRGEVQARCQGDDDAHELQPRRGQQPHNRFSFDATPSLVPRSHATHAHADRSSTEVRMASATRAASSVSPLLLMALRR